jgi:hypothetical protein
LQILPIPEKREENADKYEGGKADKYENRTYEELYEKAMEIDLDGRSKMNKYELIDALRNH